MTLRNAAVLFGLAVPALSLYAAADANLSRPKAGKVEIMRLNEVKPGMKGTAWTVFQGTEPEPVPIEIVGRLKNVWGPNQDIIVAKMGGKAMRTNVAGGMSGSPVYIDGKLMGAVALRLSVFSPDAICGITPIELMLEINDFDKSRPEDARTPDKLASAEHGVPPGEGQVRFPARCWPRPFRPELAAPSAHPADGAHRIAAGLLRLSATAPSSDFGPMFQQLGITAVQGGAAGSTLHSNQARARLGARAQPRRDHRGRAGGWRHERHRPRHRHL